MSTKRRRSIRSFLSQRTWAQTTCRYRAGCKFFSESIISIRNRLYLHSHEGCIHRALSGSGKFSAHEILSCCAVSLSGCRREKTLSRYDERLELQPWFPVRRSQSSKSVVEESISACASVALKPPYTLPLVWPIHRPWSPFCKPGEQLCFSRFQSCVGKRYVE
jgi:hypothetical protein